MVNFSKLDGTGREPRDIQVKTLTWLQENWDKYDTFILDLGVGCGKSFLAKSIQLSTNANIITPSNQLINQYLDTYPDTNFLKGMTHYSCKEGMSCYDTVKILERKACPSCPYFSNKRKAESGYPSFFNPMSYLTVDKEPESVLVIDEAHVLTTMLLDRAGYTFTNYGFNLPSKLDSEIKVIEWIRSEFEKLNKILQLAKAKDKLKILAKAVSLKNRLGPVYKALITEPEKYFIEFNKNKKVLAVKPLHVPEVIAQPFKRADKLILMSGTITAETVNTLSKGRVGRFSPGSPIPAENRSVLFDPFEIGISKNTEPKVAAELVKNLLDKYRTERQNTIIHVPYDWQEKLKPFIPKTWITHTKDSKTIAIDKFKKKGGVFLASGCSEGVDFPYDEARLNLIPIVHKPSLGSSYVSRRRTLEDGQRWYDEQCLVNTAQRIGRTTRATDDYSLTVIADPMFAVLIERNMGRISHDVYIENINWRKRKESYGI